MGYGALIDLGITAVNAGVGAAFAAVKGVTVAMFACDLGDAFMPDIKERKYREMLLTNSELITACASSHRQFLHLPMEKRNIGKSTVKMIGRKL